jgi:putative endonuclease
MRTWLAALQSVFSRADSTKKRGDAAEELALAFLRKQGLGLIARNYRAHGGEIDLIMRHGNTVVFIEVRARNRADFGGAAASVTTTKQRRIAKAAAQYLQQAGAPTPPCRFDVLAIAPGAPPQWIQAAFEAAL